MLLLSSFASLSLRAPGFFSFLLLYGMISASSLANTSTLQEERKKKLPSVSYENLIGCFSEFKNPNLEVDVNLEDLKKTIDYKYSTMKSTLGSRKVIFEDLKSAGEASDSKKRLTIRLSDLKKDPPIYKMTLEVLSGDLAGENIVLPKVHEVNPSKEVIRSYLINAKIEEDETLWFDTKPNKMEMSYKIINEKLVELDFYSLNKRKKLKCDFRKNRGVLCLCLKK